jgi:hypothetical protein
MINISVHRRSSRIWSVERHAKAMIGPLVLPETSVSVIQAVGDCNPEARWMMDAQSLVDD